MKRRKTNKKIFKTFNLVLEQISEVFPYILGFYVVCLILSYFFERWKLFFNWPVFHISVILLGILVLVGRQRERLFILLSGIKRKKFFEYQKKIPKYTLPKFRSQSIAIKGPQIKLSFIKSTLVLLKDKWGNAWGIFKRLLFISRGVFIVIIKEIIKLLGNFFIFIFQETKRLLFGTIQNLAEKLTGKNLIKIGFLAIVLIFSLFRQINPINFLVLAYALISVLFILESRIAAVIVLLFLISCPILLIFKKMPIAEATAVYAYYFLIIATATQLREYWRETRPKKVIHS